MALSELQAPASPSGAQGELRLEALGPGDVEAGLALSDAAGWNQTGDDWALFIRRGHAIGLRDDAGRWVATAAALSYGTDAGWISMVLVADAWRHRGLASRLMDASVEHLRAAATLPVLDATPAGAAVYRQIGFVPGFEIDRWERRAPAAATMALPAAAVPSPTGGEPRPAGAADLDALAALDRASTGLDRRFLLESFLARPATRAWRAADGCGFVIARAGRRAVQIGPLVAVDAAQAIALLSVAIAAVATPPGRAVFLDLPRAHRELAGWLGQQGFARQRPFVRMSLGAAEPPVLGAGMFVLAGPEFG
jgi:GNAT superfamily N-acetyltransferase